MKLKVNFISKLTKAKTVNEIVFVKDNKIKNTKLSPILKSVFGNQLFQDQLFLQKEYKNANYILVNCKKLSMSTDFENIGSKLFDYLEKNKIENSYIDSNKSEINNIQLEKVVHGAKLKSYNFDIYKSNNKSNKNIYINVIEKKKKKIKYFKKKIRCFIRWSFLYERFGFRTRKCFASR